MTNDATLGNVPLSDQLGPGFEASQCTACHGKGWNDAWKKVAGHYAGGEVFREECDKCEGAGQLKAELQA